MLIRRHKKTSLRFRQWRRKGYAVFNSVGKHVTIGSVKGIVADTLLRKQKEEMAFAYEAFRYAHEDAFDETDDPPGESQLKALLALLLPSYNLSGQHQPFHIYSSKWLKAYYSLSAIFIFNPLLKIITVHDQTNYYCNRNHSVSLNYTTGSPGTKARPDYDHLFS